MNKALMISIRPEHAVNILNGKKTLELRTWIPKDYVGWVYAYVTKKNSRALLRNDLTYVENNELCFKKNYDYGYLSVANKVNKFDENPNLIGKVVFRFWFDEYEEYDYEDVSYPEGYEDYDGTFVDTTKHVNGYYVLNYELEKFCLSYEEFENYGKGKTLYAWHIKKLEVFDEPKELSEFSVLYGGEESLYPLKKAPQRSVWIYVEDKEKRKK